MPRRRALLPPSLVANEPARGFASTLLQLWEPWSSSCLLIAGGIWAWSYYSVRESTDDARIDGHVAPVSARVAGNVIGILVKRTMLLKRARSWRDR